MSMSRCVATGTALSGLPCIVYGLCMGDLDLVMCIISHLEFFMSFAMLFPSQLVCQGCSVGCLGRCGY